MSAARRPVLVVVSDDNALVRQVAKMTSELCELIVARSAFRVTAILNAGQPIAALLADLKSRGLLDSTLIIWTGEFGRTPRINPNSGRDHFPRAFTSVLAGGGVKGGQVIGSTDAGGEAVKDRPVSVNDLLRTACHALAIDADKQNMSSIGRPIKIVDGGQVVKEVFG